ncbi:MAG: hemagglutinin repeat-containing protein [Sulfuriflexus sp.]|nr:hemagglutinin repeat-containing protein [Sulfuriflexus sp.]
MNKNIYRVIFNKARGLMMVVGEIVTANHSVTCQSRCKPEITSNTQQYFAKINVVSAFTRLAIGLSVLSTPIAQADIIVDQNSALNRQPDVSTTANGIEQINIQTPNALGLSHNIYSRFDVGRQGAILNNSRTTVQTQLGGFVLGNPNLATGTASVILNEVNSANQSLLRGFLEVAGDRAQVIVANPSGITCDGCGFINTNRATLTTGSAVINSGSLESYVVRQGVVSIEGDGLDARQTNFTDVIARAVKINANIFANDLRISTGANQVSADNTQLTVISGTDTTPSLSIDVSELGGMYAGKIRLIATEQGVGVRNAGTIGASAGNVHITADGRIINSGEITATVNINIENNSDIDNTGIIAASESLTINSAGSLNNGGGALYADNLNITATTVENTRSDDVAAVIAARDQLTINAQTLTNRDGSILYSGNDINITVDTLNNNSALIDAVDDITITATTINNTNENFQTRLVETSSETVNEFSLVGSPNRYRQDQVSLRPDKNDDVNFLVTPEGENDAYHQFNYVRRVEQTEIIESEPAQISAGGDIHITANTLMNDNSRVIAGGTLTADLDTLINNETAGQRITRENGILTTFSRRRLKGRDETKVRSSAYNPASAVQSINLNQAAFSGGSSVTNSNTPVPLLSNALFRSTPDSNASFLIETDPLFTNQRLFLSSDFVLEQLVFDPALSQKRLGDGFYEQQLVREQLAQLTGLRFLDGFANDENQYRELLNAGVTATTDYNLQPGIALSAEQIVQLTSDVVLLVEQEVTLNNGTITKALVPKLYVRLQDGDINGNGGLLAASNININTAGDLINGATIAGRQIVTFNAQNIQNTGGLVTGSNVSATADQNVNIQGGTLQAEKSLSISAGNDINVISTTSTQNSSQGSRTNINRLATLFISSDNGVLVASAGNNINLDGAQISNIGIDGQTQLIAVNDINLATITESLFQSVVHDASNFRKESSNDDIGSSITTKGSLSLNAGNNINAKAALLTSEQSNIAIIAGNDIFLREGRSQSSLDEGLKTKSKGFLSSTIRIRRDKVKIDNAIGSVVSASQIDLQAGNDINVIASDVVATNDLDINAQNKLKIGTAIDTRLELNLREKKKSGIFSSGGFGFTIGTQQLNTDTSNQVASASGSTLGSLEGDISLVAGNDFIQTGSEIVAGEGSINITAKDINIESDKKSSKTITITKLKQSGLSVAISNPILSALQTIKQVNAASKRVKSSRLKKLAKTTQVLAALNAYEAIGARLDKVARDAIDAGNEAAKDTNTGNKEKDAAADTSTLTDNVGGINISVSIGSSKNKSKSIQSTVTAVSSTLIAGNDVVLNAAGIKVKGSQINAENNIVLQAQKDIDLVAAKNTATQTSKNSSRSASLGISYGSDGFKVNASISKGRGNADGNDISFTNTQFNAGIGVGIISGEDTNIRGALVSGEQVIADIGGDLTITSLQETSTYKSKQRTKGLSISIPIGAGTISGSVNTSRSNVDANFKSVIEQSAIRAGDEGFKINVQGNTNLVGAVIASTDKAEQNGKNEFSTGTLAISDLENRKETTGSQSGISIGSGALTKYKVAKAFVTNLVTNTDLSSDQQSTTKSGIGTSNILITSEEGQRVLTGESVEATIAKLNKDVSTDRDNSNALIKTDARKIEVELRESTTIKKSFSKVIEATSDKAKGSIDDKRVLDGRSIYKIACSLDESECIKNAERAIVTLSSEEEFAGDDNKVVIFSNGINNSLERAGELAYQNTKLVKIKDENGNVIRRKPKSIYLLYYPSSNGVFSELLVAGYEKLLTSLDYNTANTLGYSTTNVELAKIVRSRKGKSTVVLNQSRSGAVTQNSFTILANTLDDNGNKFTNDKNSVESFAPAANVEDLAKAARNIGILKGNIKASYFGNDPVIFLFTHNPTRTSVFNFFSSLADTIINSNSAHSSGGTGAMGSKQVETPVQGGPQGTPEGNTGLLEFINGKLEERATIKE